MFSINHTLYWTWQVGRFDRLVDKQNYLANFNPIQDGSFRAAYVWGQVKRVPLPKIRYTYFAMIELDTVIPELKKIQKTYKSRETTLEFC